MSDTMWIVLAVAVYVFGVIFVFKQIKTGEAWNEVVKGFRKMRGKK